MTRQPSTTVVTSSTCLGMDVYELENTQFAMEAMAMQSSIIYLCFHDDLNHNYVTNDQRVYPWYSHDIPILPWYSHYTDYTPIILPFYSHYIRNILMIYRWFSYEFLILWGHSKLRMLSSRYQARDFFEPWNFRRGVIKHGWTHLHWNMWNAYKKNMGGNLRTTLFLNHLYPNKYRGINGKIIYIP
jgi:hypothetical protein